MKGGSLKADDFIVDNSKNYQLNKDQFGFPNPKFKYSKSILGADKIFFGEKISGRNDPNRKFSIFLTSDGSFGFLYIKTIFGFSRNIDKLEVVEFDKSELTDDNFENFIFPRLDKNIIPSPNNINQIKFSDKMIEQLDIFRNKTEQLKKKYE